MIDAITVGAGHNGLTSAPYLCMAGFRVRVFERRGVVGGACVTEESGAHGAARSCAAFLERIRDGVHRDPGIDAEEVARAVFAMLAACLPEAELEGAKAVTPKSLHNLWPS